MKILFLSLAVIDTLNERGIYTDLLRKFVAEDHNVYIVSPSERRFKRKTSLVISEKISILRIKTLNIQKNNLFEKGLSTLTIDHLYLTGIKKYFSAIKFDLIIYSTPPITFTKVVRYIKKKCGAKSYLLLKDIFPQNAVDLGMIKENSFLHHFFRRIEKRMYVVSDFIGCMSPANVKYLLQHNPEIPAEKVEVCPNSIEPEIKHVKEVPNIRRVHNIPAEATIFIYGGNLGKPQGLDFLLEVIESNNNKADRFFIIIGNGTEQSKIMKWFNSKNPTNAMYLDGLPKFEYDLLVRSCDVGLIFLDKQFTIPNFPSRVLSYLEYKIPVLLATDENSDLGKIAMENKFGMFAKHGELLDFNKLLNVIAGNRPLIKDMGENGFRFLMNNYTVTNSYQIIMKHFYKEVFFTG